ncbi:MAG: hypothetical protein K1X35_03645 [Caulobacteraceae bacterium]|nr:hypothetical protein [Caulobacteraceae bacterium]
MKSAHIRYGALVAAFGTALFLSACKTEEPPPPPPPPPPPAMSLSTGVVQAAAAYRNYVRDASSIPSTFPDAASIQNSLARGAAYEPEQFARGAVAYAAILALQDPAFVQGVKTYAADPAGRATVVRQLFSDPAYAAQLPGASSAAGLIIANLAADGRQLYAAGSAIKQTAYDIQRDRWSREYVADREGRLANVKRVSAMPMLGATADASLLMQAAMSGTGLNVQPGAASPPYTEAVVRGMAIAALSVLGAAGDDNAVNINALLADNTGPYCLRISKLNLYQCLAVAKPHFEDVFCLGQHVLMDAGECVTKISGAAPLPAWSRTFASAPDAASASRTAAAAAPRTRK